MKLLILIAALITLASCGTGGSVKRTGNVITTCYSVGQCSTILIERGDR